MMVLRAGLFPVVGITGCFVVVRGFWGRHVVSFEDACLTS
jgi:hypothetical protein